MNTIKAYDSDDSDSANNSAASHPDQQEQQGPPLKKHKPLLPCPPSIIQDQNYSSTKPHMRLQADNQHLKRHLRQFYASIEFTPTSSQSEKLDHILENVNFAVKNEFPHNKNKKEKKWESFQPCYKSPLRYLLPLHVSLTPNYQIPTRYTSSIVSNITSKLHRYQFRQRTIEFDKVLLLPNLNWTRTFACLNLTASTKLEISQFTKLIRDCIKESIAEEGGEDNEKEEFVKNMDGLEWDDGRLHVTFAESATVPQSNEQLKAISDVLEECIEIDPRNVQWRIESIKILTGEKGRVSIELE